MTTNDGGPAFLRPASIGNDYVTGESGVVVDPQMGMSLRDWFAGQIVQGVAARSMFDIEGDPCLVHMAAWARYSYRIADAMLKARQQ
jgi:hypothetical protein